MQSSFRRVTITLSLVVGAALSVATPRAQLRVVTTIPDLADLAAQIGGERVAADSLTAGHEDFHMVRPRPSLLIKMRRAEMFIELGLDAEHAWVPTLMRNARNQKIRPGADGFCNASIGVTPLQIPKDRTRASGPDIHPSGNPHYNLDPERMRTAARNIRDALKRVDSAHADEFAANYRKWEQKLDERLVKWREQLEPVRGAAFIEYHNSWVYFAKAFDLRVVGQLEPKPGLAPTPTHLRLMVARAEEEQVGLIVARPQNIDIAKRVAKEVGAKAAVLQLCSARAGKMRGWFEFMDHVVKTFASNLRPKKRL